MPAAPKTIKIGTLPPILPNYQAAAPGNFNFWTQPQGVSHSPVFNIPWLQNLAQPGTPGTPGTPFGGGTPGGGPGTGGDTLINAVLPPLMPPTLPPTDNVLNGLLPMEMFNGRGGEGLFSW